MIIRLTHRLTNMRTEVQSIAFLISSLDFFLRIETGNSGLRIYQAGNYMFKVNNRNTAKCEICSKLTIVNFEQLNSGWVVCLKGTAL